MTTLKQMKKTDKGKDDKRGIERKRRKKEKRAKQNSIEKVQERTMEQGNPTNETNPEGKLQGTEDKKKR